MAKTLRQILGGKNLSGVIQGIKSGIPTDGIPQSFFRPTRTVEGDHCTYRKVEGTRKTARLVHYGSPSKLRNVSGVSEIPVKLLHSFEHMHHDPSVLMNLTNLANDSRQALGQAEISRQTREFKDLFQNLRKASIMSALLTGLVYFDGEGNLLPSSSGSVVTVDYGIPDGNKDQCDMLGDGDIIDAVWSAAGTDIHTHIKGLKDAAVRLTGYPITQAFYGKNILDYMWKNTVLKEMINRKNTLQDSFTVGEISDGFLGIKKWMPISETFYVDDDGDFQDFIGDDDIVFTPDPSPEWWEVIEGTYPVPTDIGQISADAMASISSNVIAKKGMFSYAQVLSDPVTVKQLAGDTFLPVVKVPNAVVIATVAGF